MNNIVLIKEEFNKNFTKYAWISNNFIDNSHLLKAIDIFQKENDISKVDEYLSSQYSRVSIEKFISNIKVFEKMKTLENLPEIGTLFYKYYVDRLPLIQVSKKEYLKKNYICCIPILLSIIDGIVNDIDKATGFFSEQIDLVIADSIVGNEQGLKIVKEEMYKGRSNTNKERITIPYRNGILHGRDLNYGNKIVASKCWSVLFALLEWARDNNSTKFDMEEKSEITQNDLDNEVSKNPKEVIESILSYLINGNKYHKLIYYDKTPSKLDTNKKRMGAIKKYFENDFQNIKISNFNILNEFEMKENIVSFEIEIKYTNHEDTFLKNLNFLFEYLDIDNQFVELNQNGSWKTDFACTFPSLPFNAKKLG
ncbi:hypothetical protein [Sulfurimonas sp.]|uniref:hypothetical protein n=1 Tax=Sulfurimonas sp. TaxID=2022749 RepID=UPI0025E72DE8|nr:hypothetical protein [Sulfurimonas sp.]MDD5158232.1 hypothetical protein [Sulfurimonas sp.]